MWARGAAWESTSFQEERSILRDRLLEIDFSYFAQVHSPTGGEMKMLLRELQFVKFGSNLLSEWR